MNIINLHEDIEMKKFVGKRLKYFRTRHNLSQATLGEILGVKNNSICAYEKGRRSLTTEQLTILSNYFNVSISDFFPKGNERELNVDEEFLIEKIIESSLQIPDENRVEFLKKLDILIKLFQ